MRIAFWDNLLILTSLVVALAQAPLALSAPHAVHDSSEGSKSRLEIRTQEGKRYVLRVLRDSTVPSKSQPSQVQVVGELKGSAIIVVDSYRSKPGGMSYCQAGYERFLRVISVSSKAPKETFRVKIDSCRENIELASRGIEWSPESSTLRIRWLLGPSTKGTPEERTVQIGRDGKPSY
ncbi:MAG TPA: hypothetical protein VMH26_17050 [Burkholderiales bacterium]|nr:hypothetical protein [Burkholderiales bacterium]